MEVNSQRRTSRSPTGSRTSHLLPPTVPGTFFNERTDRQFTARSWHSDSGNARNSRIFREPEPSYGIFGYKEDSWHTDSGNARNSRNFREPGPSYGVFGYNEDSIYPQRTDRRSPTPHNVGGSGSAVRIPVQRGWSDVLRRPSHTELKTFRKFVSGWAEMFTTITEERTLEVAEKDSSYSSSQQNSLLSSDLTDPSGSTSDATSAITTGTEGASETPKSTLHEQRDLSVEGRASKINLDTQAAGRALKTSFRSDRASKQCDSLGDTFDEPDKSSTHSDEIHPYSSFFVMLQLLSQRPAVVAARDIFSTLTNFFAQAGANAIDNSVAAPPLCERCVITPGPDSSDVDNRRNAGLQNPLPEKVIQGDEAVHTDRSPLLLRTAALLFAVFVVAGVALLHASFPAVGPSEHAAEEAVRADSAAGLTKTNDVIRRAPPQGTTFRVPTFSTTSSLFSTMPETETESPGSTKTQPHNRSR